MSGRDKGERIVEIKDLDFCFENSRMRIIADRNYPEIELAGLSAGPFEEGNEYEVCYWLAQELAKAGIAHFHEEDCLDATKLYKVLWKERVQVAGQISELTDDFYPKLRRYLSDTKSEIAKNPEKAREFEKAKQTARDIVNFRLKKIVSLASGPAQTAQTLKKFTSEERLIYKNLSNIVRKWKRQILHFEK